MSDLNPQKEAQSKPGPGFVMRVLAKAALLFVVLNGLFALANPLPAIGRISLYNTVLPGRHRLPFGENPESYNLSLFQLEAMFASHEAAVPRPDDEYRVLVVGDSSVWGILLHPDETLAAQITALGLTTTDGRVIRAYNMGYPTISVLKDLLVISHAMSYEPDMIVWLVTLEAMPTNKQLSSPLVQYNAAPVRQLIETYDLNLDVNDPGFVDPSFWERTIVGQRRALADVARLNLYGVMWASTGIDQYYPETYNARLEDLPADEDFYDLPRPLTEESLAFDVLEAGIDLAGDIPVVMVNEPMFISAGENSDIRYNFYYPRWAYDDYRRLMAALAGEHGWHYLDLWDAIPATEFTNSAIHLTPTGSAQLAGFIGEAILSEAP
jgi:hypothetical protein